MRNRNTYSLSDAAKERVYKRLIERMDPGITPLAFKEALLPENPGMGWGHYVADFCRYLQDRGEKESAARWLLAGLAVSWGEAWAEVRKAEMEARDALRMRAYRLELPWPVYSEGPGDTVECPGQD